MFILDINKLLIGDVILTAQEELVSKVVRKTTDSAYSHAILYVGDSSYIHSDSKGVHAGNILRLLFKKESDSQVLRLRGNQDPQRISDACLFARTQIGKQYSIPEAIKARKNRHKSAPDASNRQFCSRLVAQAYANAGIMLVPNPDYCYPKDFGDSELIEPIEGCMRKASADEIQFASSENPLDRQTAITNNILNQVRDLTSVDIQSFEQVVGYLMKNPQHDDEVSNIVSHSGYLEFWKIDVDKNPWRYDAGVFLALNVPRQIKLDAARHELEIAKKQLDQFQFAYSQYMALWQQKRLKYIAIEIHLYLKLIDLVQSRITVATHVLTNA